MKKHAALLLLCSACGCGGGEDLTHNTVVNFYNWSDYIAEDTLSNFETKSGIKVNYDVYDSNEALEAKLLVGRSGYDLVVPGGPFFATQRHAGLYQPLDESKLPGLSNLDQAILEKLAVYDPENSYGVLYAWGAEGIGVNVDLVSDRIPNAAFDTWDLLFKPENASRLQDCGITLLDAPADVVEVALIYLGYPSSDDLDHLREAFDLLAGIRPYVRYFHSSQYIDDLANGEICLAFAWPGDVFQAMDRAGTSAVSAHSPTLWTEDLEV